MGKKKIKVVRGVPLKDLPGRGRMLYFLDGFYHKYGTDKTLELIKNIPDEQLACIFLKAWEYCEKHPEEPPVAELPEMGTLVNKVHF